jgi:hypothetical protein
MLSDYPIVPNPPAIDLARARKFYSEKLALEKDVKAGNGIEFKCGGRTSLWIYQHAGRQPGDNGG